MYLGLLHVWILNVRSSPNDPVQIKVFILLIARALLSPY